MILMVNGVMTIRELSAISGVHNSNIARIENGKLSAGIDTLSKITHALEAKVEITKIKED